MLIVGIFVLKLIFGAASRICATAYNGDPADGLGDGDPLGENEGDPLIEKLGVIEAVWLGLCEGLAEAVKLGLSLAVRDGVPSLGLAETV